MLRSGAVRLATVSQFSAKDISERYSIPADRIDVVYNGAATAYHQPLGVNPKQAAAAIRRRMTGGQPFFVFVGTQHPRKNLEGLLKAFQSYRREGRNMGFAFGGHADVAPRRRFNAKDILAAAPGACSEARSPFWLVATVGPRSGIGGFRGLGVHPLV